MTQSCEEKLISDVAATKALLEQFMEQIKPTLATKEEVRSIEGYIDEHVNSHKENRGLLPVWIGMAVTASLTIFGFFIKAPK